MTVMPPVMPERSFFSRKFSCWTIAATIVIIFFVAASIMVPCGMHEMGVARKHGQRERTRGDMKTIAVKLEEHKQRTGHYPYATDIDGLMRELPDFFSPRTRIIKDGWGNSIRYSADVGYPSLCKPEASIQPQGCGPIHYTLVSAGKDGKFAHDNLSEYAFGETHEYDCDIVMQDGAWLRQPVGKQVRGACSSE